MTCFKLQHISRKRYSVTLTSANKIISLLRICSFHIYKQVHNGFTQAPVNKPLTVTHPALFQPTEVGRNPTEGGNPKALSN